MASSFNQPMGFTVLSPEEEVQFQSWYAKQSRLRGTNPDPDAVGHQFDYRAAWKSGWNPTAPDEHGSSQFKTWGSRERFVPLGHGITLDSKTGLQLGNIRKRR